MSPNPPTQYRTDANVRARQRLWQHQQPPFDLVAWVLDTAELGAGSMARVLDVGCGNGAYLSHLLTRGIDVVGCDLSNGMLAAAAASTPGVKLVNADVTCLPFETSAFDIVLAPHMLYHVSDRRAAALELRRVLRPGGRCLVVTNGTDHMRSLRSLVETAVRLVTLDWEMRDPSTEAFSLENGADQLRTAFQHVTCHHASGAAPVVLTDASIAADYVASTEDHYQPETLRPWSTVVDDVRRSVNCQSMTQAHSSSTGEAARSSASDGDQPGSIHSSPHSQRRVNTRGLTWTSPLCKRHQRSDISSAPPPAAG